MPRKPRFNLVGVPQHIIQRGNNRELCFYSEKDYWRYLEDLRVVAEKYDCRVHAYVLMTNHVHLLVTPMIDHGIPQMMQSLGRRYVFYINKTYRRTGTFWEWRYKASLFDSDRYFLTCMRYIELNPVRANMVEHPAEYQWASYQCNAQGKQVSLIEPHPNYLELGSTAKVRQQAYRELFVDHIDPETLHEIRDSLNHELVFGRSYFKDKVEELTNRQTRAGVPGRPMIGEVPADYVVY
ncbi:MAG: transposase [Gammaproteobacteria bacterium]